MSGQRNVQLLGRSINLTYILTQHLNNKLRRDVEFAISRFESSDARGVVDLTVLLNILSDMHHRLSPHVHLDPFPHILHEINNCSGRGHRGGSGSNLCVSGRIARHMFVSLQRDIAPNFSYNAHTHRFVPSPIAIRPFDTEDRSLPFHFYSLLPHTFTMLGFQEASEASGDTAGLWSALRQSFRVLCEAHTVLL